MAQGGPVNAGSGKRAYYRFQYGTHFWIPLQESDLSRGMVRDAPRIAIPVGGVYDATDFLLHQPGVAIKRGGTAYAGPALTSATYGAGVVYTEYPAGSKVVAIGDNGHIYTVTSGTTTDVGGSTVAGGLRDIPKLRVGASKNLLVIPQGNGTSGPLKYDGSVAPAALGGTPPAGKYCAIYKTRLALAASNANPNRIYFSPTPDIESTWDTTNSWIDCDYEITGLASMRNALIIFSKGHTERIIGSTPPPNSDMDRSPLGSIGCTDARSIVTQEGNVLFANPRGVYLTNGAGFASLTTEGQIETYWQSLFSGYNPSTWTIASGVLRSFYIVSILDGSGNLVDTLMCNVPRRAWWRLTNIKGTMMSAAVGDQDELYYADRSTNRVVKLAGIFSPSASNMFDANGNSVSPAIEYRALGDGPNVKSFGNGHLTFDMDTNNTENPLLAITVKTGLKANEGAATPAESPLQATSNGSFFETSRKRFTVNQQTTALTIRVQQTNDSARTEIYALEVDQRHFSDVTEPLS